DLVVAALATRPRRAQQPGPLAGLGTDCQRDAAAGRTGQTQIDVMERPLLAAALVVDDEVAILEAEFAKLVPVKAGGTDPVDPGEQRTKVGDSTASGRQRRMLCPLPSRRTDREPCLQRRVVR